MQFFNLILLAQIILFASFSYVAPRDSRLTLEEVLKEVRNRADELGNKFKDETDPNVVQKKIEDFFKNVGQHLPRMMRNRVERSGENQNNDRRQALHQILVKLQELVMSAKKKTDHLIENLKDSPAEFAVLTQDLIKQIKDEFHPMVTRRSMPEMLNDVGKDEIVEMNSRKRFESKPIIPIDFDNLRQDAIKSEHDTNYLKSHLLRNRRLDEEEKLRRDFMDYVSLWGPEIQQTRSVLPRVISFPDATIFEVIPYAKFKMPKLWTLKCAKGIKKYIHKCV